MPLLALAMTGFICIVTETLPAGLLPQICTSMHISSAMAGQMVTVYAIGSLVTAIPLTIATRSWNRKHVLLLAIVGFLIFNSVTAFSNHYSLTLISRFFAGTSAGLAWSIIAGYARRLVATHQQGRALAIAMIGTPIALSLGVPLGTWMGNLIGWRMIFWIMSAFTLILIIWIVIKMPDYVGQTVRENFQFKKVLTTSGVRSVLAVVLTWMLAHNILYTYIAPFVETAGLGNRVDLILFAFGMSALIGIWITGRLVDAYLRRITLISLATFTLLAIIWGFCAQYAVIVYIGVIFWGITFGGAATLLQTALADAAGNEADVALSINVVVWNTAIAIAGIIGGILLNHLGVASFPWVISSLLMIAFLIVWNAHSHGFKKGYRNTEVEQ
ncbi:MFS transporter [Acinetobacter sichuanensis]|uniref:MFS transporter n=1 Tax=Acinetobacter sichuanensis TaxID=2136183 RepID=UPI00280CE37B|nr:MFS transporter [Acinetobacter sichuanensis]MDQ9021856.1 MFS transporter [Acinetobacter sichuanensis]